MRKLGFYGACAVIAATFAIGMTVPANAAVSGSPQFTNKATGAVAGYFSSGIGVNWTHIQTREGGNGVDGAIGNLDPGATNGAGIGMCDTAGPAVQLGLVNNGDGTMNIDYGYGTFLAPAKNNDDLCENGVVNPLSPHVLIGPINITHTVDLSILFDGYHAHNGCHAGQVLFEAVDDSNPAGLHHSPCIWLPHGTNFNEIDAGVVANDALMSGPALNPLVTFAHLQDSANLDSGRGTVHGSFQSNSFSTAFPVISTSNGLATGTPLLKPDTFFDDHFKLREGSGVA
jgi:hypothetical protein